MSQPSFIAIRYPAVWPPPDLPPYKPLPLSWIPLLGWLLRYFTWLWHNSRHIKEVLNPIADEIIAQLNTRPIEGPWPSTLEEKLLAKIISDAVSLEKGLEHSPALHPDDPFPLLFWGPFDDLTPIIVRSNSSEKLRIEIPPQLIIEAWNNRWTIQQFIQKILEEHSIKIS